MKRKICLVLTSRGNYGKTKSIIQAANKHDDIELQVIIGGSLVLEKYGKILDSEYADSFQVDAKIHFLVEGETPLTMAKSAGLAVSDFATAFGNMNPDLVVVIADRFECLPVAMAATYMNIPVAHIEGGEISGSIDESIRHAITKLSYLHFPCSEEARDRIIRMGENAERVHLVGSTSFDVLANIQLDDLSPFDHLQEEKGVGKYVRAEKGKYLIVIQHPVTTEYEHNRDYIQETVDAIDRLEIPTFWLWPNMDAGSDGISKGIRQYREARSPGHVHFFKSLPIELFGPLLKNAGCIVGNSSSGIREAAFLGTPAVNIGNRQIGRDRGKNVIDVPNRSHEIVSAVRKQLEHGPFTPDHLYGDGSAGPKIVDIMASSHLQSQKINSY